MAQKACWNEWEYKDPWLVRAGNCSENVSIPDFERGFCKARMRSDELRTAARCPTMAKTKEGLNIVTQPMTRAAWAAASAPDDVVLAVEFQ